MTVSIESCITVGVFLAVFTYIYKNLGCVWCFCLVVCILILGVFIWLILVVFCVFFSKITKQNTPCYHKFKKDMSRFDLKLISFN